MADLARPARKPTPSKAAPYGKAPAYRLPYVRGWRPPHERTQKQNNVRGMAFLAIGLFIFMFQDVIIKSVSGAYPVHQIVFLRSIVAVPCVLAIVWFDSGLASLATRQIWLHLLRGLVMFASYLSYYLALAAISLAEVVALNFTSPLFITLLSMVILRERVGIQRILAILVGFVGVLIIVNPGDSIYDPAALLAILAAVTYALSSMLANRIGREDSGSVMAFYSNLIYLGVSIGLAAMLWDGSNASTGHPSLQFLSRPWAWPPLQDALLMGLTGVISAFGSYFLAQAYRTGQASVVAPFEYTGILWATLWGFVFFNEIPTLAILGGIALIVAAGIFVIYRETNQGQQIVTERGRLKVR